MPAPAPAPAMDAPAPTSFERLSPRLRRLWLGLAALLVVALAVAAAEIERMRSELDRALEDSPFGVEAATNLLISHLQRKRSVSGADRDATQVTRQAR